MPSVQGNSKAFWRSVAMTLALCAGMFPIACGGGGTGTAGAGGVPSSGGTSASGGKSGGGGASASGGTAASSGGTVSGGSVGSGGSATGGRLGSGGSSASGGSAGAVSGGSAGQGGAAGSGGNSGSGSGGSGSGGSTGQDGGADVAPRLDGIAERPNNEARPEVADTSSATDAASYQPCTSSPCKILPLGDSITEGCCTAPEGGYRIELFTKAVNSKQNITFVGGTLSIGDAKPNGPTTVAGQTFPQGNEGNGGYTIASPSSKGGIAGAITDQSCSTYKPDIVLLMIGTNDILQNIDLGNAPTRLGSLMDEIMTDAPSALLVVSSIPPCCNDTTVQAYNATIPDMVKTRAQAGKHVLFVDAHAAFVKDANYKADYISSDGLHPSANGYAVVGDLFYAAISPYLP
jgi:lysophospholipase L1-like esterase